MQDKAALTETLKKNSIPHTGTSVNGMLWWVDTDMDWDKLRTLMEPHHVIVSRVENLKEIAQYSVKADGKT
jgi:hypothetical protein